jgi:hypothetical protein
MDLVDRLAGPATGTVARAREVLERFATPALVNHSLRSSIRAAACAEAHGIAHDAELLLNIHSGVGAARESSDGG